MKKRIIAFLLMTIMLMSSMTNVMAMSFSDLAEGHWAYNYITTLTNQGVINGYTDGTFRPAGKIKRAEFLKLITVAALGEEEANSISVPEGYYLEHEWYAKYVYWAEENSMLFYYYSEEEWESNINRIEMVRLLYEYAEYVNLYEKVYKDSMDNIKKEEEYFDEDTENEEEIDKELEVMIEILNSMGYKKIKYYENTREEVEAFINELPEEELEEFNEKVDKKLGYKMNQKNKLNYNDIETLDESDRMLLEYVSELELINGYDDGSFKPYKFMSRAEVATIIYRYNSKK